MALKLEDEVYKVFKQGKAYCDKCRSILYNLGDESNKKPLQMLISRGVTPEQFVKLETSDIASD